MSIVSHLHHLSTPKCVNPTSIRCAGKIDPSSVPAVRATTLVRGAPTTTSPACNATAVKSGVQAHLQ